MTTPHIAATPDQIADTVLLPGDPLRAAWIAEHFLDDAEQVTGIRNILGFTGTHNSVPITVMGTGMGVPSISIYATELARFLGAKRLIRIGSCGSLQERVEVGDVIVVTGASTDSNVNRHRSGGFEFAAVADFDVTRSLVDAADGVAARVHRGVVLTSDLYYEPDSAVFDRAGQLGHLAVEMECAGLFGVAAEEGVAAAALLTVSDHLLSDVHMTAEERQTGFQTMVMTALAAVTSGG